MAPFGENYRGGREEVLCPMCGTHRDSQALLFQCKVMEKHFPSSLAITNLYSDNIDKETVKTLEAAMIIRDNYIQNVSNHLTL